MLINEITGDAERIAFVRRNVEKDSRADLTIRNSNQFRNVCSPINSDYVNFRKIFLSIFDVSVRTGFVNMIYDWSVYTPPTQHTIDTVLTHRGDNRIANEVFAYLAASKWVTDENAPWIREFLKLWESLIIVNYHSLVTAQSSHLTERERTLPATNQTDLGIGNPTISATSHTHAMPNDPRSGFYLGPSTGAVPKRRQSRRQSISVTCSYCHKRGHPATQCWHRMRAMRREIPSTPSQAATPRPPMSNHISSTVSLHSFVGERQTSFPGQPAYSTQKDLKDSCPLRKADDYSPGNSRAVRLTILGFLCFLYCYGLLRLFGFTNPLFRH